jgi:predicted PurR-regulated permease PerM
VSTPSGRAGRVTRDASARRAAPVAIAPDAPPREALRTVLAHPFGVGFFAALGAFVAWWLGGLVLSVSSLILLIVVAMFLAAGLHPATRFFERRGLTRGWSVLVVIAIVLLAITLFFVALVPVIADQVRAIADNAPDWFQQLRRNRYAQRLDEEYDVVQRAQEYVVSGDVGKQVFGGVVGVGVAVLSTLANTFIVIVLTLYFLASLERVKQAAYQFAPSSKRAKVSRLGDKIVDNIGAYVSGAFIVALCAGLSTLVFLFIVGMGQYAVALAAVVALLDVIPMIGATLGAVVVSLIGFATDPTTGIVCVIFYVVYQQLENYVIYPRVMARSVDIPGSVIVIAALIGAGLLGVVGALLAIPTAAAILLVVREVVVPRLDVR